jgi:hypothetical protein
MGAMVSAFDFFPPPPNPKVKTVCGIISYNGRMRITFANITRSTELERVMLKHLAEAGIHVKILNIK